MRELEINGIYRHFKGDYYLVIDIAGSSENDEKYEYIGHYTVITIFGLDLFKNF